MQPPALGGHCRLKIPILQKSSWSRMVFRAAKPGTYFLSVENKILLSLVLQFSTDKAAPAPDWKNWAEVPGENPMEI